VSGERDPFEWLPDELIVMIMLMLPFEVLWVGVCDRVCLRWTRLMESAPVKRHKRDGRWPAYEAGVITSRELVGHTHYVIALAVGLDGKVYSGSWGTIRVWSSDDGAHIQTLEGHTRYVEALAVGLDGKIYSGSMDRTIRVWSGDDGTHLQTLVGHTDAVLALAVGLDGKVYSGSNDTAIQVWSGDDGTHLQTIVGHTNSVNSLTVGLDGKKVYAGSWDGTIRVWSGDDGTHLQTLVGHTDYVTSLAVGLDGKVFSGSNDGTIRVWSGVDGTHIHTLIELDGAQRFVTARFVHALAVMRDGTLVSGGGHYVENEGEDPDDECAELKMW
jgi:WD40 repeat protein